MIFNNAILKENAKIPLRQTYWMAFAVSLFCVFIEKLGFQMIFPVEIIKEFIDEFLYSYNHSMSWNYFILPLRWFTAFLGLFISILSVGFKIFISNPFKVSHAQFYMNNRNAPAKFTNIFKVFDRTYLKKVSAMFMKDLFVSLWSLLLFIPGVIAKYRYWAVKYIINENPNLSWHHALDMSKRMTYGRKWNIFVLEISFIGWYFLGSLLFGIGTIFVHPYANQTYTEAYEFIKQDALKNNRISYNEFNDMD